MNTNQLIILWYGGLAFLFVLLSGISTGLTMAVGLGVVFLYVLTGWHHSHHVNHRKLMVAIVFPSCLLGILAFAFDSTEYDVGQPPPAVYQELPADQIKVLKPRFQHRFFLDQLSGEIQNNSSQNLNRVKLSVSLFDDTGPLEEFQAVVKNLNIPPGQTGSFSQTVGDPRARFKKNVKWTYQVISALGKS